ncbi:MAG TPA: hypothetical protein VGE02_00895, partial [Gemmatimonadales bacterium]
MPHLAIHSPLGAAARRRLLGAALAVAFVPAGALAQDTTGASGTNGADSIPRHPSGADSATLASPQYAALALESYGTPPAAIARLVDAPRHLNVTLDDPSPDRSRFLAMRSDGLPPATAFARPWYNLGGVQIDRQANRARSMTLRNSARIELLDWKTGRTTTIEAPSGARVTDASWSPTGREVAFLAHYPDATHIYVADAATGRSRRLTKTPVLATMVTALGWTADGKTIATVLLRDGHGAEPARPAVAPGPNVRLHFSGTERNRTYASLLETPHEMALLEHFITGQLALVDVASGRVRKVGSPAMFRSVDVSPDGTLLRVTTIQKPFSYTVPVSSFGTLEELWDVNGRVVAEVARRPLREGQGDGPGGGDGDTPADTGRRNLSWSPDGKGLVYLQLAPAPARTGRDSAATDSAAAQGGGRGGSAARRRDRVVQWLPPYDSASARVLYESDGRMSAVAFSDDAQVVFVNETQNGIAHSYAVFLNEPGKRHTITRGRGTGALPGR